MLATVMSMFKYVLIYEGKFVSIYATFVKSRIRLVSRLKQFHLIKCVKKFFLILNESIY